MSFKMEQKYGLEIKGWTLLWWCVIWLTAIAMAMRYISHLCWEGMSPWGWVHPSNKSYGIYPFCMCTKHEAQLGKASWPHKTTPPLLTHPCLFFMYVFLYLACVSNKFLVCYCMPLPQDRCRLPVVEVYRETCIVLLMALVLGYFEHQIIIGSVGK